MTRTPIEDIDEATRCRLLADDQRRFLITRLRTANTDTELTLEEIASHMELATRRAERVESTLLRNLRCRLHHVHLPMLADAGVLDYDAETKSVRLVEPVTPTADAS